MPSTSMDAQHSMRRAKKVMPMLWPHCRRQAQSSHRTVQEETDMITLQSRLTQIAPQVLSGLQERSLNPDGDLHKMIQEFVYANWILVGNGDGTVNLLVPVVEGESPPDELLVAPYNHITNIQEVARRTEEIAILGC